MSEHTPGPWIAGTGDQPESEIWIEADGPNVVAAVWGIEVEAINDTEAQANARLIAAVPDLLEALERINNVISGQLLDSEPGLESDPDELLWEVAAVARRAIAGTTPEHRTNP